MKKDKISHIKIARITIILGALFCFFTGCYLPKGAWVQAIEHQNISGNLPVFIPLPAEYQSYNYFKISDPKTKESVPAQKINNTTLVFLPSKNLHSAGVSKLRIESGIQPFFEKKIKMAEMPDGDLLVSVKDKPILRYNVTEKLFPQNAPGYYKRSGFIHPLYAPNGEILTDAFPIGHTHQHALFFAFVNTTYQGEKIDFWNQQQGTGTARHSRILEKSEGPVFAEFKTEIDHISNKHGILLKEIWTVTVYAIEDYYMLDIASNVRSVGQDTLFVNQYHYGGMAIRGSAQWNKEDSLSYKSPMQFMTNENKSRTEANHSRPIWTSLYGAINGEMTGLAMMGFPTNFRHPEPIRIHPEMPYFSLSPMVEGTFPIPPNHSFESKYRIVTFDDNPSPEWLNEVAKNCKE